MSIAGTEVAKELQLSAVSMGYIFSAFGWAYLLMQIPGGWLLDKFGSKKVYTYSLFFWSLFTFLQGFVDMFPLAWAGISMFFMRFMQVLLFCFNGSGNTCNSKDSANSSASQRGAIATKCVCDTTLSTLIIAMP